MPEPHPAVWSVRSPTRLRGSSGALARFRGPVRNPPPAFGRRPDPGATRVRTGRGGHVTIDPVPETSAQESELCGIQNGLCRRVRRRVRGGTARRGLELEERQALRRVAGLSTELRDITEVEYRQLRLERVVLVGVWTEGTISDAENSLAELAALAETAGSQVLEGLIQRRGRPDPATYIGRGKVGELRDVVLTGGADTVICDGELSPGSCATWSRRSRSRWSTGPR